MNRLVKIFGVLLVMSALIGFQDNATLANDSKAPNVLFIAVDDLRGWARHLGGHPNAKTPNIDRLAKRGISFTRAYCSAPLCNPSRISLLTGIAPFRSGVYGNGERLRNKLPDAVIGLPAAGAASRKSGSQRLPPHGTLSPASSLKRARRDRRKRRSHDTAGEPLEPSTSVV